MEEGHAFAKTCRQLIVTRPNQHKERCVIETMLTLSTAHLRRSTCDAWLAGDTLVAFAKGDQGWFVPVPDASVADIPDDLAECFALARANRCDWVMFDGDTSPLSILPVYDAALPADI